MPQQDPIKPGQVTSLPQVNYDPNAEAGKVTSNLPYVAPPTAPNLLFDNTAPTTAGGASKVNPAYALYINTLKNNNAKQAYLSSPYYTKQSATERYEDNDLGGYHPFDMNLENWYGDNQSWFKQWGNRLGKTGTKAVGSFANSLMDIPNMINAVSQGNLDKMWDNPVNSWATDLMDWSERNLPNYETNWEREHPFINLVPIWGNSGNGWGKVVENLGFTLGAVGGAVVEDLAVGAMTGGVGEVPLAAMQINKAAYKLGKFINMSDDALGGLKASIKSADDIVKGLKGIDRFNYAVRQGLWGANMITSGISEAAFEGIESYKNLSKDLQQQFFEENGRMPSYEDNQRIDRLARDAGNSRFLLNSALLAVTNSIQWGNLLRPLNATRDLLEAEAKQGVRVALREGSVDLFEAVDRSSKIARWGRAAANSKVGQYLIGSSSEGFEEGAQFAIEKGVDDFYKRKYDAGNIQQAHSFMQSFGVGMSNALGSQEGWENIVYGLLGGAMYKGGESAYYKMRGIDNNPNYKKQIDSVIEGLNTNSLSGIFENKYREAVDAISIQKDLQQAAADNNVFLYQNYKHDQFVNFVLSGLSQNKFETRMEQLQELKKLDKGEFEKMFGIPSSDENKAAVSDYVDVLERNANYIKDVHKRVSRTFINPFTYKGTGNYKNKEEKAERDRENEQYIVYEQAKDDLVRTMAIAKNSVERINSVRNQIADAQTVVDPDTVIKLSSVDGIKELKKEYAESQKLAEASLALAKDPKKEKDAKWYKEKVDQIDAIIKEEDRDKQNEEYNKFLNDVFDRTQKENNTYYSIHGTPSQVASLNTPFPRDVIKDLTDLGKDVYYLQKQNEIAIDRYARLTTKGGFKDLFEKIAAARRAADALNIVPETPAVQGQAAQQQTAFNAAQEQQGQTPTAQPQAQNPAQAQPGDIQGDMGGYVEETVTPIGEDQLDAIKRVLVRIAEGQEKVSEEELDFSRGLDFGFKTIDDVKSADPKADLNNYVKVKAADTGKFFYMHKDVLASIKKDIGTLEQQVPQDAAQTSETPTTNTGALRTNDFLGKVFVPQDAKQAFNNAIFSGTKDQVKNGLRIVVRPLSPELQKEYDDQKAKQSYKALPGFPGVFVSKSPIDLSIYHSPNRGMAGFIGAIGYPKRLLFKVGNQFVTIDKLTPEQYAQFTKRSAAQQAADVEEYNKQVAFTNLLASIFKQNGNKEFTLDEEDLEGLFDISITYGEEDRVEKDQDRPPFSELKYSGITIPTKDGSIKTMVILSVPRRFSGDELIRERTGFSEPIYGQNFYDTATADDSRISDYRNSSPEEIAKVGSRYVGLVERPDGSFHPIALRPGEMTADAKEILFNTIKTRSAESAKENFVEGTEQDNSGVLLVGDKKVYFKLPTDASKSFNDNFNTELNNQTFISDRNERSWLNLSISPIGAARLEIHEPDVIWTKPDGKQQKGFRAKLYIAPQIVDGLNNFDDLINQFNKEIDKEAAKDPIFKSLNIKLDSSNFRQYIAKDSAIQNAEQIAPLLTASTTREVFKNGTMRILPNDQRVQTLYKEVSKVANQKATPEQTKQGEKPVADQSQVPTPPVAENVNEIAEINKRRTLSMKWETSHAHGLSVEVRWTYYAPNGTTENYSTTGEQNALRELNARYDAEIAALSAPITKPTSILSSQQAFTEEDYNNIDDLFGPTPTGMFAGLSQTDVDASGDPIIVEEQNTVNQEDIKDIEFNSVKEALNANDIDYRVVGDTIEYFIMSTDDPLDLPGISPKELAAEMNLKVKEQQKPSTGGFDFMRANSEVKALDRMMNIEGARAYIHSILPTSIQVKEVDDVIDEIREQGIENPEKDVWGAFRDGIVYLNRQSPAVGQEYHEAFHAVFNTFIPQEQRQKLLDEGKNGLYKKLKKEGKSIRQHISEQQASGVWTNLTTEQATEKASEEWMAEEFRNWKNKKKDAGLLDKLFDLIDRFFRWILRNGSDLDALFRKIDTGGYRYSNIAGNSFTQDTTDENTTQEFKFMLIPTRPTQIQIGKGTRTKKNNLDAKTSKQVVQNVSAYFEMYRKTGTFKKISDDKLLDEVLDSLKLTYDPKNALYAGASQEQLDAIANSDENFIYSDENTRKIIKEAAKKYINSMNYFEQFGEDELEESEQETGAPKTGYDNQSENVGGFSSIPGMLRHYIGFTSYQLEEDKFGNKALANKQPIIATVDAVSVYYGLLRATANINDPVRFFQRMIKFADNNEQSNHFVRKFIKDSGLDEDILFGENRIVAKDGGNKALIEIVRKGFNKYRIDYTFTEYDMAKAKYNSYHANRRNVENVQFDKWSNTFIAGYAEASDAAKRATQTALDNVRNKYFDERRVVLRSAEEQKAIINEARNALLGVGIQVSYDYIRYSLLSIAAKKFDALNTQYKTQGVELQFDDPKNTFISKADYNYVQVMKIADEIALTKDFMDELSKGLAANANPFFREIRKRKIIDPNSQEEVEIEEELDTAMVTRILNVGKGNAFFDETVGESSFTTADNKVVFAHQDGTFNVKASYGLRDANFRKQLRENGYREEATSYMDALDSEWLTDNHLLKSDDFEAVADNLLYQNIDGMRAVETNSKGKVITQEFRDQKEGVTYGSYSAREFFINNLNFYVSGHKIQKTNKGDVVTTPHLIRVLEASKTGATVNLPVNLDIYRDGTVTEKTLKTMLGEVTKEYNRIQRTQRELGTRTENIVENYHTGSFKLDSEGNPTDEVDKGYRGLKFSDNMTSLISKTTAEMLERKARAGQPLSEQDQIAIKEEIKTSLNNMVEDTIELMTREGIIKKGSAMGNYQNVLLDNEFFNGNAALNLQTVDSDIKFKTNIGHVLINDYINTLAYNQILHGDPALSLKNDGGIDAVKRAKGDNAAIVSIRTDLIDPSLGITKPFTHSSIAIFKEPIIDKIKIADAQMYTTTEGLRYTLWGLGRLSPRVAAFIDALERGDDIHNLKDSEGKTYDGVFDDDNGLLRWDEMTNSLKLVYKDGKTYFKMSVVVLQPNLTAMKNEQGEWITLPGWETLDNLRRKMEADGIHFAAPESASKMMTLDVSRAKDFSDLKGHLFDNTFFGLQTENPSNKLEITTPTQLLQLIDSEQDDSVEVFVAGAKTTVGAVKNQYQEAVAQKVTNAYEVARDEIYNITDFNDDINKLIQDGKVEPRLAKFYERVSSTLEASGADAQLQEFFELDDNGNIKYNANLSAIKTKAQQLYLAYFSKGIMSQKSPGYTVALFSGIDTKTVRRATKVENGRVVAWEHVRRDQWASNHKGVRDQRILNSKDQVTAVGQLFTDELQYNVPNYDKDGNITGYHSEMMLPAHFAELLGLKPGDDIPDAIAYMFGVRIPSQDKHSFMSLKLIDFLPANLGSTGMFPKEIVKLSGADFDIDKLYITRPDFYTTKDKNGKTHFKKYGSATNDQGKWGEYKRWMLENNKSVKNTVRDILLTDKTYQDLLDEQTTLRELQMEDAFDDAAKQLKKDLYNKATSQAFKALKLPSTLEEFIEASKTRELNNGVLNNKILDYYVALQTNKGMQDIAKTPATLTALENIQKEQDITLRDSQGNVIASVFEKKTNYPVDSPIGKYYGFRNNTTGKNNIGIDVNANLIYSVLNKGNIRLEKADDVGADIGFIFDGQHFGSFAGNREYNLETKKFDGKRTNDVLSTLITAATDEAKEQLNALYNLGVDALKVVNYLVSLKVPLKTAIYFVNQPSVRNYLELKAVKQNTIQTVDEDKLKKDTFQEEAKKKTYQQIRDYKDISDKEMMDIFTRNGIIEIDC